MVTKIGLDVVSPGTDNLKLVVPESQVEVPDHISLSNIFKRRDESRTLLGVVEKSCPGKGSFFHMD